MSGSDRFDTWTAGTSYEAYMGRWSRLLARAFVAWLDPAPGGTWIDVGCGTGALTDALLAAVAPRAVLGVDASPDFVAYARSAAGDPRASFAVADAPALPAADASLDGVVAGLVLNFLPDPDAALAEMRRVLRPGGQLGFVVWDYAGGGMQMLDRFWTAATALDPAAAALDERRRFPEATRSGVGALCARAGLAATVAPIEIVTEFADFEDFWRPFTRGAGPAPGYCRSLDAAVRGALRDRLATGFGAGSLRLGARAWAARATIP